jgi:flagellin-like protein
MKILKSKKALSPVVASIILIAVTVAVSIAVAAWMGALSIGFMGSSSVTITDVSFETPANVTLFVKNTGTKTVTIATVKVNSQNVNATDPITLTLDPGNSNKIEVRLASNWTAGNPYKFDLYDGSGQIVGSYQATAPS